MTSTEDPSLPSGVPPVDGCAAEPIHIPGKIQPHGVLFAVDAELVIRQVSANTDSLLGRSPDSLLGTPLLALVRADAAAGVERLVREAASTFVNPFRVPVTVGDTERVFDGIAHTIAGVGTVLELEFNESDATGLPALEGLENYLQIIQRSLEGIANVSAVDQIAERMAADVKDFTGFDRVMVYRFAPDFHGHVIAEAREPDMEPYLGLHYPASDIPAQARELYLKNQVRLLEDVQAAPVPVIPTLHPATGAPLDMSRAVLRAMSPIHIQYLKNMGVGASLSISLVVDGKLWGLIACHHRSARFVPYAIRATACLYAIVLSAQIQAKQLNGMNERLSHARQLALSIFTGLRDYSEPMGSLPAVLPKLAELFGAESAALLTHGRSFRYGPTPCETTLDSLAGELSRMSGDGLIITAATNRDFPSLSGSAANAAGMVAIHLGDTDWLTLFRPEISREVKWAGDPRTTKVRDERGMLTPRESFEVWMEQVDGRAEEWPEQTSAIIHEVRLGMLEILRRRNALLARSNEDLRRFAGVVAHEVKGHLQTGILALSLLEERLESSDEKAGRMVSMGRSQLLDLAKFTNDMLAFARTDSNIVMATIDLGALCRDVVSELQITKLPEEVSVEILELPVISGPPAQMRHVLSNLIRNAVTHGRRDHHDLKITVGSRRDGHETVVFVQDDGQGVPAEQRERIFDYFYRVASGTSGSGIGLAFCAQVLNRMEHRIWVEDAKEGSGSVFCFSVTPAPME